MNTQEILQKTIVSKDLQLKVESVVLDCLAKAQASFGEDKVTKIPNIRYNTKGRTAGFFRWTSNSQQMLIDINPILLNENVDETLNQTVPHEMAHCIAYQIWKEKVEAHGWQWRLVMRSIGKEPIRCHNMDTSTIDCLRKKHSFACKCEKCGKSFNISAIRKNRILSGRKYYHTECGRGKIVLVS